MTSRVVTFAAGLMLSFMTTLSRAEDTKLTIMVFGGSQNLPLFAAQTRDFFAKRGWLWISSTRECRRIADRACRWALANHSRHI
jgi:hypothetical protein